LGAYYKSSGFFTINDKKEDKVPKYKFSESAKIKTKEDVELHFKYDSGRAFNKFKVVRWLPKSVSEDSDFLVYVYFPQFHEILGVHTLKVIDFLTDE
jgi:hypothetical protein